MMFLKILEIESTDIFQTFGSLKEERDKVEEKEMGLGFTFFSFERIEVIDFKMPIGRTH